MSFSFMHLMVLFDRLWCREIESKNSHFLGRAFVDWDSVAKSTIALVYLAYRTICSIKASKITTTPFRHYANVLAGMLCVNEIWVWHGRWCHSPPLPTPYISYSCRQKWKPKEGTKTSLKSLSTEKQIKQDNLVLFSCHFKILFFLFSSVPDYWSLQRSEILYLLDRTNWLENYINPSADVHSHIVWEFIPLIQYHAKLNGHT